jgi:hypothetical protein
VTTSPLPYSTKFGPTGIFSPVITSWKMNPDYTSHPSGGCLFVDSNNVAVEEVSEICRKQGVELVSSLALAPPIVSSYTRWQKRQHKHGLKVYAHQLPRHTKTQAFMLIFSRRFKHSCSATTIWPRYCSAYNRDVTIVPYFRKQL